MSKMKTPRGNRLHIGIFGRRNVGKSSLLNIITNQNVSIVSNIEGTTTDPVEKTMELQPIGPVLFIDTAGIDDVGVLGEKRIAKTNKVVDRTDLAIVVATAEQWGDFEVKLLEIFKEQKIPVIVTFNKSDVKEPNSELLKEIEDKKLVSVITSTVSGDGIDKLRSAIIAKTPNEFLVDRPIVGDLVAPYELVMLVVPIDMEAPKGRLILPQVQTIRDLLDNDAMCMVVKERELKSAIDRLKTPPALVVTDSQAFLKVDADTPKDIPLTSFSILFARQKGDLKDFVEGALAIDNLRSGSRVLIFESCSHHPIGDDIGRVKIPRWLRQYVGGALHFEHHQGHDFPDDISSYDLVIQCGGCVHNRKYMLTKIARCKEAGVPITNYGMTIAYCLGIFPRALEPFKDVYENYKDQL